mmetsp:Transcript_38392/g.96579  ORF Transcript_38392/g.96579 Transcript_38392/m.96579 type:complete len:214 (-) Transcript_38392:2-643(-)
MSTFTSSLEFFRSTCQLGQFQESIIIVLLFVLLLLRTLLHLRRGRSAPDLRRPILLLIVLCIFLFGIFFVRVFFVLLAIVLLVFASLGSRCRFRLLLARCAPAGIAATALCGGRCRKTRSGGFTNTHWFGAFGSRRFDSARLCLLRRHDILHLHIAVESSLPALCACSASASCCCCFCSSGYLRCCFSRLLAIHLLFVVGYLAVSPSDDAWWW